MKFKEEKGGGDEKVEDTGRERKEPRNHKREVIMELWTIKNNGSEKVVKSKQRIGSEN